MDNNQGQNQNGQEGWTNASESNNGYTQQNEYSQPEYNQTQQDNYSQSQYNNYSQPQQDNYSQYNGNYTQQQYNYSPQGQDTPGRGYAIASMVLGICGIVFCFCYGIIGIICSVLALVMHHNAVKMDGFESSYAKAGKICGIIGIVFGVITLILSVIVMILGFSINSYSNMNFM